MGVGEELYRNSVMVPALEIVMLPPLLCLVEVVGDEIVWFDCEHDASAGPENTPRATNEALASNGPRESHRPPGGAKIPEI